MNKVNKYKRYFECICLNSVLIGKRFMAFLVRVFIATNAFIIFLCMIDKESFISIIEGIRANDAEHTAMFLIMIFWKIYFFIFMITLCIEAIYYWTRIEN